MEWTLTFNSHPAQVNRLFSKLYDVLVRAEHACQCNAVSSPWRAVKAWTVCAETSKAAPIRLWDGPGITKTVLRSRPGSTIRQHLEKWWKHVTWLGMPINCAGKESLPSSNLNGNVHAWLPRCIMRSSPKSNYPCRKVLQCIQIYWSHATQRTYPVGFKNSENKSSGIINRKSQWRCMKRISGTVYF